MTTLRPAARKIVTAFGVLAIALGAMTASATPVRADNDAAKVLAGIAAIAIIGAALNDSKDRRQPVYTHPQRPNPGWHQPQRPQPQRPQAHGPNRHNQNCVQSGRNVVCGQPVNPRRAQVQPHRPQPQGPGWHNNRRY